MAPRIHLHLLKIGLLIGMALLTYFVSQHLPFRFLFFLPQGPSQKFMGSIALLPLGLAFLLTIEVFIASEVFRQRMRVLAFGILFFAIMPSLFDSAALLAITCITFLAGRVRIRKSFDYALSLGLGVIFLIAPLALGYQHVNNTQGSIWLIVIFKMCLALRLVSYLVETRVYNRHGERNFWDLLEFALCPIFFVLPGHIQLFRYGYFLESRSPAREPPKSLLPVLGMTIWALFLMALFSWGISYYWANLNPKLELNWSGSQFALHSLAGLFWLFMVYFEQAGAMSYQVALARLLGYEIKYDMHWPLLSRSPLDYLRRHSSYVRDYVVEIGLKPSVTWLLRRGVSPSWAGPLMAIFAYAVLVGAQSGPRADFYRPGLMTLAMILSLAVFILLPVLKGLLLQKMSKINKPIDSLARPIAHKSLRSWEWHDYLAWILTLGLLVASKALINLAALYSIRH